MAVRTKCLLSRLYFGCFCSGSQCKQASVVAIFFAVSFDSKTVLVPVPAIIIAGQDGGARPDGGIKI